MINYILLSLFIAFCSFNTYCYLIDDAIIRACVTALDFNSQIEFLIHEDEFWESYNIERRIFPFDEYMEMVMEKFMSQVTTVRVVDWFILLILCLANAARVHWSPGYAHCTHEFAHQEEELALCFAGQSLIAFWIAGFFNTLIDSNPTLTNARTHSPTQ